MPIIFGMNSAYNSRVLSYPRHLLIPVCCTGLHENLKFSTTPPDSSVFTGPHENLKFPATPPEQVSCNTC